jgi:transcriptional regulator with XRE-family HTH domain
VNGEKLRALRESLGLTLRDVETASVRIAERRGDSEYLLAISRLSDFETKGIVPTIHKLYSLAAIYRVDFLYLLSFYRVEFSEIDKDCSLSAPPRKTHTLAALDQLPSVRLPVKLDPSFDIRKTTNIGRMIAKWGVVPFAFLEGFTDYKYTYGYIGSDDFTMYPLLMPGSFVQIDESRNKVADGMWRSEYERPMYFVETREGFTCCWCTVRGGQITLQSHPLSPVPVRTTRYPQDAEVLGQVVGIAMHFDWRADSSPSTKGHLE